MSALIAPGNQLYVAPFADEGPCDVTVLFDDSGHVAYADEQPEDRDIDGVLWERWGGTPSGPRQWALHHPARQREVMDQRPLCAVCSAEPDCNEHGVLWLLNADAALQKSLTFPRDIVTATPAVCLKDARRALRACHVLQQGFIALRVREAELVGVRGTVYSPTNPPQVDQDVRFDDDAIHRVIARQLLRELRGAVLDKVTLADCTLRHRRSSAEPTAAAASVTTMTRTGPATSPRPARKIALFDLDDTLTDHTAAFARWAAEYSRSTGIPLPWLLEAEQRHAGARHHFFEEIKSDFGIRTSIATLHAEYRRRSADLVPHRPEVCTALEELVDDGWALGVVTNGSPDAQRIKLDMARLTPYFDSVVVSGEYGVRKPDPALFRVALDELHADESTWAAMVGDRLDTDIQGGVRAGLHTVWIAAGRTHCPEGSVPTLAVDTTVEACDWLRSQPQVPTALVPTGPTAVRP
ncbi:HAD family hydrolase [Streptomyces alanosinicus]|uniref:HAD family hydrolase n=1 Tax=Streptomyces alanosinicus TaxID=68171 RepID=UPI001E3C4001|nr:HAD family hydrolase [Streptomyces alanosinicus]